MRRPNDSSVLQPSSPDPILANTLSIDLENDKLHNIKTLLNFKKVVVVGKYKQLRETVLKLIKEKSNPARIWLIDEEELKKFLESYPMFSRSYWARSRVESKQLPVLLMDSDDIVEDNRPGNRLRIFAHPSTSMNQLYTEMGITDGKIIKDQSSSNNQQEIFNKISKYKEGSILI